MGSCLPMGRGSEQAEGSPKTNFVRQFSDQLVKKASGLLTPFERAPSQPLNGEPGQLEVKELAAATLCHATCSTL